MNATKQHVATLGLTNVRSLKNLNIRENISDWIFILLMYVTMIWFVLGGTSAYFNFLEPNLDWFVDLPVFLIGLVILLASIWQSSAHARKQSYLIKHFYQEVVVGVVAEMPVENIDSRTLKQSVVVEGMNRAGNTVRENIPIDATKWRQGRYVVGQRYDLDLNTVD